MEKFIRNELITVVKSDALTDEKFADGQVVDVLVGIAGTVDIS